MNGDKIAVLIDLIQADSVADIPHQTPGRVYGQIGVIAIDFHAKLSGRVGDHNADGTQADDAQSLALDLVSGESLFGFFRDLAYIVLIGIGPDPFRAAHDIPGRQDQAGDDQLLDSVGVGAGRVKYNDTLFRAAFQRNVIDTGTGSGDGPQAFRKFHFFHIRGTDQDSGRFINGIHKAVSLTEFVCSGTADLIQAKNLTFFHGEAPL